MQCHHYTLGTILTSNITPAKNLQSDSEDRRRNRRSESRSRSRSSDIRERPSRKKSKRQKAPEDEKGEIEKLTGKFPVGETEEEYDARLEREENERVDAQKKRELERIKRKYESEIQNSNGIRFKG